MGEGKRTTNFHLVNRPKVKHRLIRNVIKNDSFEESVVVITVLSRVRANGALCGVIGLCLLWDERKL
jgi:hypothetical protein